MKLTGKKSAKRAVNCKFCYSKIKIRWPKVPGWVKQCWAQQLLGSLVTVKTYSRSFWNLIEIILGEFSWNCIISVHVEVQKEKEKFAVMCLRRGVHKTSHKIIERLRFMFTPNGKREFVPRDQVSPLIVVYCLVLLHRNK